MNPQIVHQEETLIRMPDNPLTVTNVDEQIGGYCESIAGMGDSLQGKRGLDLFVALKREAVGSGPYPDVSLFEAANRIMTDLVILYGVKWLLTKSELPFESYDVNYGHRDDNDFDLRAIYLDKVLVGEAFNVAPSFFQGKKGAMLKKLRDPQRASDFRVLLVNEDASDSTYAPRMEPEEFIVFVSVDSGDARPVPENALQKDVFQKLRSLE